MTDPQNPLKLPGVETLGRAADQFVNPTDKFQASQPPPPAPAQDPSTSYFYAGSQAPVFERQDYRWSQQQEPPHTSAAFRPYQPPATSSFNGYSSFANDPAPPHPINNRQQSFGEYNQTYQEPVAQPFATQPTSYNRDFEAPNAFASRPNGKFIYSLIYTFLITFN